MDKPSLAHHVPSKRDYDLKDRHSAEKFARDLLDNLGLTELGWRIGWNNRKRAFGLCDYGKSTIYLSRFLFPTMTAAEVYQTIVHEAAHALAPGAMHGARWKQTMRRLGVPADRCGEYTEEGLAAVARVAKWRTECDCGACSQPRLRRPNRKYFLGYYRCRKCKSDVRVHKA